MKKLDALRMALAYVRWQAFGECRSVQWDGPPPEPAAVDEALVAALAAREACFDVPAGLSDAQIETAAAAVGLRVAAVVAFRRSKGQNMTGPEQDDWNATVRFANTIAALAASSAPK